MINAQYCAPRYDTRSDTVTNAETLSGLFCRYCRAARPMWRPNLQKPTLGHISWNDGGPLSTLCKAVLLAGNSVVGPLGRRGTGGTLYEASPFFQCSSLEIGLAQRVLTRLCTTCHGGRLTCQSEESCPQVAIRGEKKVARCPLWGKSGVSHRKSPLGVAASQGDSTLAQVTGGQTPPHRAPAALSLS